VQDIRGDQKMNLTKPANDNNKHSVSNACHHSKEE